MESVFVKAQGLSYSDPSISMMDTVARLRSGDDPVKYSLLALSHFRLSLAPWVVQPLRHNFNALIINLFKDNLYL